MIEACNSNRCSSKTFRRLEAYRIRTSFDIIDCEATITSAHEIIEQLQKKASNEITELGCNLVVSTAGTLGKIIFESFFLSLFYFFF